MNVSSIVAVPQNSSFLSNADMQLTPEQISRDARETADDFQESLVNDNALPEALRPMFHQTIQDSQQWYKSTVIRIHRIAALPNHEVIPLLDALKVEHETQRIAMQKNCDTLLAQYANHFSAISDSYFSEIIAGCKDDYKRLGDALDNQIKVANQT